MVKMALPSDKKIKNKSNSVGEKAIKSQLM
jgi:hypothetical protein